MHARFLLIALAICAFLAPHLIASDRQVGGARQTVAPTAPEPATAQAATATFSQSSRSVQQIATIGGRERLDFRSLKDLPYTANAYNRSQMLDLYLPNNAVLPVPLVVFIHGGSWFEGDKSQCPALPMVPKGYAVASINYRLTGQSRFPAQIYDCKAAIRWLRAHANQYGLNPQKIAVWGSSAGGQLAALLGTSGGVRELEGNLGSNDQDSRVQAVVDWFGPADFLATGGKGALSPEAVKALVGLFGALPDQAPTLAKSASPITYVSKEAPTFLIMHGDRDQLVPAEQSKELDAALKKVGAQSQLVIVNGAGHDEFEPKQSAEVFEFLQKRLRSL